MGHAIEPHDEAFADLERHFEARPGVRSVIRVSVDRISDSCGFGVPRYEYQGDRDQLLAWSEKKGDDALRAYERANNRTSLDGLPGLRGAGAGTS